MPKAPSMPDDPTAAASAQATLPRLRRVLGLSLLALVLAVGGLTAAFVLAERRAVEEAARQTALFRARLFEEHARRTIDAADMAVRHVLRTLPRDTLVPRDAAEVRALFAGLPQVGSVWVVDATGRATFGSMLAPGQAMPNLADRDYVRVHRERPPTGGMFVGGAIQSRVTGKPLATVSRRLDDTQGRFAGVVAASLDIGYFRAFYQGLGLAPADSVGLFSTDGRLIVSAPPLDGAGLEALTLAHPLTEAQGTADQVALERIGGAAPRAVARRRVAELPLVVVAAVSLEEPLADWRANAVERVVAVGLGLAVATLLGLFGLRALGREQRAREALAAANARLTVLSQTDPLTGLANRRACEDVLEAEWRRCGRARLPLAVLMVDVDAFKAYNDALGHHAGDLALRRVAAAVGASAGRPGDLAARYGGEEMIVVLPNTTLDGARVVAEAIHDRLRMVAVPHPRSPVAPRLTVSIGVACRHPDDGGSPGLLVDEADEALYEAKHRGRNRTELHKAPAHSAAE